MAEALEYLSVRAQSPGGGLNVVGFSLGAWFAIQISISNPARVRAVALFYGSGGGDFSQARAAYLGHFAGDDPYEPPEAVDWLEGEIKSASLPVMFHRYPGVGHWFCEPDRPEAYNEAAAQLAWKRTVAFLKGSAFPRLVDCPR